MKTIQDLEQLMACMSMRFEDKIKELETEIAELKKKLGLFKIFENNLSDPMAKPLAMPRVLLKEKLKDYTRMERAYKGAGCSCSPPGHPHSYDCKGWYIGDPAYEERCPQCDSYEHRNTGQGSCPHE